MANVTINIKNCGCGGGTGGSSGSGPGSGGSTTPTLPESDEWGDPSSPAGPPEAYFEPTSGLSDRQCKVAIFLYDWLEKTLEFFATTDTGYFVLTVLRFGTSNLGPILTQILLTAIPIIISLMNGVDLTDAAVAWLAWGLATTLVAIAAVINTNMIGQPLYQDTLDQVKPYKDQIICQISEAPDAFSAYQAYRNTIESIDGMTFEQKTIAGEMLFRQLFNLLFYTSDYWPSFDDDYLANITATCCGDYVPGDPVVAGSAQACSAATFIVDQLVDLFKVLGETGHAIWTDFNPFDNLKQDYRDYLEANLTGHKKIRESANWNGFLNHLAEHVYLNRGYFFQLADVQTLWEYYDDTALVGTNDHLNARLLARRSEAIDALFNAADKSAAYTALDAILDAEIDLIDTEDSLKTLMKNAVEALINPAQSTLLDLLFIQDVDLLGYPGDCSTFGFAAFDFEDGAQGFAGERSGQTALGTTGYYAFSQANAFMSDTYASLNWLSWVDMDNNAVADRAGVPLSGDLMIQSLSFDIYWAPSPQSCSGLDVTWYYSDGSNSVEHISNPAPGNENLSNHQITNPEDKPVTMVRWGNAAGDSRRVFALDNVRVYGEIV